MGVIARTDGPSLAPPGILVATSRDHPTDPGATMPDGMLLLAVIGLVVLGLVLLEVRVVRRRRTQSHADHRENHDPPPGDGFTPTAPW